MSNRLNTNNAPGVIMLLGMIAGTSYTDVDNYINYQIPDSQHSSIRLRSDLETTDFVTLGHTSQSIPTYQIKEHSVAPPKDYRERYAKIATSDWFKRDYYGKSIGDIIVVE